jgi:RimK family alpha-L-glutamate ligase
LQIGVLTRDKNSWCSRELIHAFDKKGIIPYPFSFNDLVVELKENENFFTKDIDLSKELDSILVRPIGRGSLEEIIYQLDILHSLNRHGTPIVNNSRAIEIAADKYMTLSVLHSKGIPIPKSVVTENIREAIKFFKNESDVLVKPVFGSRGIGISRLSDIDLAERIFRTLRFHKHVLLLQEFIPHNNIDIRVFIVGGRTVAAMKRKANTWRTNVSQGATPLPVKMSREKEEIALKAAEALNCEISGVDLLEGKEGIRVLEVNSQPGWRGLQSISSVNIAEEIADYMILKSKGRI